MTRKRIVLHEPDPAQLDYTQAHDLSDPRQLVYPGGKDGFWIVRCSCGYQTAPHPHPQQAQAPALQHQRQVIQNMRSSSAQRQQDS